jgi:Zn-finger nucleic acid-binding protein
MLARAMDLFCPICPNTPMRDSLHRGVPVNVCDTCHGQWLQAGELEQLAPKWKTETFVAALAGAPGRCTQGGHAIPEGQPRCGPCEAPAVHCPVCRPEAMRLSLVYTPACSVEVCGRCHGLWLDANELAALRNVAEATILSSPPPPKRPDPDSETHYDKAFKDSLVAGVVGGVIQFIFG